MDNGTREALEIRRQFLKIEAEARQRELDQAREEGRKEGRREALEGLIAFAQHGLENP